MRPDEYFFQHYIINEIRIKKLKPSQEILWLEIPEYVYNICFQDKILLYSNQFHKINELYLEKCINKIGWECNTTQFLKKEKKVILILRKHWS